MQETNVYNYTSNMAKEVDEKQAKEDSDKEQSNSPSEQENSGEDKVPEANDQSGINPQESADQQAKKFTYKNLEGEIELTPTKKNFSILAGSTIHLAGVGKYLSGFYYVMSRKISLSNNGAMSITLQVTRTNFGDSLKGEKPLPEQETVDLIGDGGSSDGLSYSGEGSETYSESSPYDAGDGSSSTESSSASFSNDANSSSEGEGDVYIPI